MAEISKRPLPLLPIPEEPEERENRKFHPRPLRFSIQSAASQATRPYSRFWNRRLEGNALSLAQTSDLEPGK